MKCVIFLHFHKAGGTTINSFFKKYNKWKPNRNGNPLWLDKKYVNFWDYNREEFNIFKNILLECNIEFIAFEWNYFKFYKEIDYSNIELITCIREPYKRFISNMCVDKYNDSYKYNNATISERRRGVVNYNKYNYYTKMLNGFGNRPNIQINDEHLEIAKKNLSKFSIILILEDKNTFKLLQKYKKICTHKIHKNKNKNKKIRNVIDINDFKKKNKYDYELYEYAKKLSYIQLKNL